MKFSTTTLISSAAALLMNSANAGVIHNSCLQLSELTLGQPNGENTYVTNEVSLINQTITTDMHLEGFVVCTDGSRKENVQGLQFFFSASDYRDDSTPLVLLDPIGKMTGECGSMRLAGPLDMIKASTDKNKGVNGLQFKQGEQVVQIGDVSGELGVDKQRWDLTDKTLMGLYGEQSENGIETLGFITLDTACQAALDKHPVMIVDEGDDKEPTDGFEVLDTYFVPEERDKTTGEVEIKETEEAGASEQLETITNPNEPALSSLALTFIILGCITFCAIIVFTVYVFRRGITNKAEHGRISPGASDIENREPAKYPTVA